MAEVAQDPPQEPKQPDHNKILKRIAKLDKFAKFKKPKKTDSDSDSSDTEEEDKPKIAQDNFSRSEIHYFGNRGRGWRWFAKDDFAQLTVGEFLARPDGTVYNTEKVNLYPSEIIRLFEQMADIQEVGKQTKKAERVRLRNSPTKPFYYKKMKCFLLD